MLIAAIVRNAIVKRIAEISLEVVARTGLRDGGHSHVVHVE